MSSETLLADESTSSTDATTTQSAPAQSDEQAASEQQTTVETETPPTEPEAAKPEGEAKAEPAEPEKSKDDKGEVEAEEQHEGAPELYEFDVPKGMPEGFELGELATDAFAKVARELDLPQDKAQSILNSVFPALHKQHEASLKSLEAKFRDLAQNDPRIGGAQFESKLADAKRAVEAFDKNGLAELLNGPWGSHPDVIDVLATAAKAVSEDNFVGGKSGSGSVDYTDDASLGAALARNAAKQQ